MATPIDSTWEGVFNYPALSPDGSRLVLTEIRDQKQHLWVKQLDRGPVTRLTFEGTINYRPQWMENGRDVVYISDRVNGRALPYRLRADGSGKPEPIAVPDTTQVDEINVAPGGTWIVYRRGTVNGMRRIAMFRPGIDTVAQDVSVGRFDEYSPAVSPDGRWLTYVSSESGREEVYIRPFPDVTRARWQVSTTGGSSPVWSPNGKELFFVSGTNQFMAATIAPGPDFRAGAPQALFSMSPFLMAPYHQSFVVAADGQHFILAQPVNAAASEEYANVLIDWIGK